jgi:hypothetical protein
MTAPRLFLCAAALASWLAGCAVGLAQAAAPGGQGPGRVEVSVAAGLFLPTEDSVSRVYDGTRVHWTVDGDIRIAGRLSAFAGLRSLTTDGRASGFDPASGADIDTSLSTRSLLLGVRVHHRWGRLGVFAGGGAARTSFTETWPGVDAEFSGDTWGPLVQGGVVYRVWRRVGIVGRVDWFQAPTGEGSLLDASVDLGGLDVSGGVTIRF